MTDHDARLSAFAAQLKAERVIAGLTLDEMHHASGVSRTSIALFEKSQRTPNVAQLLKLCDALDLNMSTFMRRVEDRAQDAARSPSTSESVR